MSTKTALNAILLVIQADGGYIREGSQSTANSAKKLLESNNQPSWQQAQQQTADDIAEEMIAYFHLTENINDLPWLAELTHEYGLLHRNGKLTR
jgi:hypothetical protein